MLAIEKLTKIAFQPFGDVVDTVGEASIVINEGFAERYNGLANIDVSDGDGVLNVSIFNVTSRPKPLTLTVMERHPLGSQLFAPMQNRPWLVVVCSDPLDVCSYRVFAADGSQGVNYRKNTWHHPVLCQDPFSRFLIVDRAGPGNNLEEYRIPHATKLVIDLLSTSTGSSASWPSN